MTCPDLNKHFKESCELLRFDANKLFKIRKLFANFCTSYECTQIQFTIQVYTKIVYYTSVQKTSLLYKYTQNQFIKCIQIWELINGMYIHGQNITTECTGTAFPASACLCLPLPAFCCSCLYLPLPDSTCFYLLLPASACLKIQFWGHTDRHT